MSAKDEGRGQAPRREEPRSGAEPGSAAGRPRYEAPRIVKKRMVSRATLFTGTGTDTGGVVSG